MSILNPIPLLQGRGGATLSAEPDCLVFERPGEELTIRLRAVARVRAEERAVAVELRARAGAEPLVYRIEDVSEVSATLFTKGVNALLPKPGEGEGHKDSGDGGGGEEGEDSRDGENEGEAAEEIDGAALVVLRTRRPAWRRRFLHRIKWLVLGCQGLMAVMSVAALVAGDAGTALAMVPFGFIATAGFGVGGYLLGNWRRERRLVKRGVTTVAEMAEPGAYLYQDPTGIRRVLAHWGEAPAVPVAYDARDPSDVVALQLPATRRLNAGFGAFLAFCALNAVAMMAVFLAGVF
ncbi:hypothetical protein ACGFRB_05715 [Streptomyces sp. NPDC048718]|uniref:hypothetical protein n=1 Tax=Streptomyces sp. NPDC048718 TaxID=3365587 RepID=UPI0037218553